MVFNDVFAPFIERSPVSVMFRGTLENVFTTERLDELFERTAQRQCCRELAFSTCVDLLSQVVTQAQPSLHAAFRQSREKIGVSVQALYQKLAGVEPAVCEALVRETAVDLAAMVDHLDAQLPGPLPGYDVRIVDGNHLQGTHHRLKELRRVGDAALPGHTLAVLNPHRELIEEVVVCPDGHANQKPLFRQLLKFVQPRQCWLADRDFSTLEFLFGIAERKGFFLIRQHGALHCEPEGRKRSLGRTDTGVVHEQPVRLTTSAGEELVVRRITLQLDQPTRDKATELHLLTNLPAKVSGLAVAGAYRARWKIENAFYQLTMVLRCELNTLGYPQAALLGFCLAVTMYNAVHTVTAALRVAHPTVLPKPKPKVPSAKKRAAPQQAASKKAPPKLSFYYLADEIAGVSRGMEIVITAEYWTAAFGGKTSPQMARMLLWLARKVSLERFLTNPASEKKRKARRPIKHGGHVSTHRLLQKRKKTPAKRQH
jgi:hypothetical protein